jgi:hypothetical protein
MFLGLCLAELLLDAIVKFGGWAAAALAVLAGIALTELEAGADTALSFEAIALKVE